MIARLWRGAVTHGDGDAYSRYMQQTGIPSYLGTPGNHGVWMLHRDVGQKTEFLMFTLWESFESIHTFAGHDAEVAVVYPEDDRFLIERDERVLHYAVDSHEAP